MRKTLLCLSTLCIFVISSNAQITKGSIFLGGDLGAYTQKTTQPGGTSKITWFNVSPVYGKAIKENLILGGNLGFGYSDDKGYNQYGMTSKGYNYSAGVFLRKYKPIGKGGFYIFLQGGINAGYADATTKSGVVRVEKIHNFTTGLSVYPGVSFAISKRFHLETGFSNLLSVSYFRGRQHVSELADYTVKSSSFGFSTSLNNSTSPLYLGFRVLLGK